MVNVQERPVTVAAGCNDTVAVAVVPFTVPVRVAVWFAVTVPVEMLKVPATEPAATVTDAGTVKVGEALLVNVTTAPPVNATFDSVTVHVVPPFEVSVVNVHARPRIVGGVTSDSVAVAVVLFNVPVRVAVWFVVIVPVEILNVPVVAPAATVTEAGTVKADDALLVNVTAAPPVNAASESVTVHVVPPFEVSVVNVHATPRIVGGVTSDSVAVAVVLFNVPVRVAV